MPLNAYDEGLEIHIQSIGGTDQKASIVDRQNFLCIRLPIAYGRQPAQD